MNQVQLKEGARGWAPRNFVPARKRSLVGVAADAGAELLASSHESNCPRRVQRTRCSRVRCSSTSATGPTSCQRNSDPCRALSAHCGREIVCAFESTRGLHVCPRSSMSSALTSPRKSSGAVGTPCSMHATASASRPSATKRASRRGLDRTAGSPWRAGSTHQASSRSHRPGPARWLRPLAAQLATSSRFEVVGRSRRSGRRPAAELGTTRRLQCAPGATARWLCRVAFRRYRSRRR